jgi:hypothetical protein
MSHPPRTTRPLAALLLGWLPLAACLLALPSGAAPPAGRGDKPRVFRAGAFAIDVTPERLPISVNGGMQDRQATAVHDRLHARCLVLDDGATRLALVVCDSCMIPRELLDEAKRLASKGSGIPADRMLIAATHTHTAPTVAGVFQSEPDKAYQRYLTRRIAEGVAKAVGNLRPARVGWGVGRDPTQVFNLRWKMKPGTRLEDPFGRFTDRVKMNPGYRNPALGEPAGPVDPEIGVLSVQARDGRPLALLANYSLHYVGGAPPLSADYFGAFAERVRGLLGAGKGDPPFVGVLSNGTSGDINNINFAGEAPKGRRPYEQIRVVAGSVAAATHAAYKKIEHHDWAPLAMAEREVELGVRLPDEKDLARAREVLKKAGERPLKTLAEVYARETVLLAKYPAKVRLKLQAVRVGELGVASSPCETFAETGLEVKKKSPLKPTFVIELANGYNGYLPTPGQHKLGGYETWRARSSCLEVDASTKITATLLELLRQVARAGKE